MLLNREVKFFIVFILLSFSFYSVEIEGDIKGIYSVDDLNNGTNDFEAKVYLSKSKKNLFTEVSFIADDEEVEVYRAYLDLYKDKLKTTIGKQAVYWGNSYIFNNINLIFNEINLENPREETYGVNSLDIKYNFGPFSRSEFMIFEKEEKSDNYAIRHTFTISNFEFMAAYFDYKSMEEKKNQDFIFEIKGDLGIGFWTQYASKKEENERHDIFVAGGDYSFNVNGKTLYCLLEGAYDFYLKSGGIYLMYSYSFREDIMWTQGFVNAGYMNFVTSKLTYLYSDDVDLNLIYNYYDDINSYFEDYREEKEEIKNKISLEVKVYF